MSPTPITLSVDVDGNRPRMLTSNPRQYWYVLPDWEVEEQTRKNCPAIVNLLRDRGLQYNPLRKDWIDFWCNLNEGNYQKMQSYANSSAFITDHHGLETDDPRIETKTCCGNVICVDENDTQRWLGETWVAVQTLDITKSPPTGMTWWTHPHLIQHATNLLINKLDPLPHLGGRNTGVPVYFPLTSNGTVYINKKLIKKLPLGSPIPNPYIPAMAIRSE